MEKLTKKGICELLNVPFDGEDEEYTALTYAIKARPGCIAVLHNRKTDKLIDVSMEDAKKLAEKAMMKGAKCLLCSEQVGDYPCIVVPGHPIASVERIAGALCDKYAIPAVEITGSYGKTTVKYMIHAVLKSKYDVIGTLANDNMMFSVVEASQRLRKADFYVQEATEAPYPNVPGRISNIIRPKIAVVTTVGTSHIETMGSKENICVSCLSLQSGMRDDGVLILNADDEYLSKAETYRKTVYYGIENKNADFFGDNIRDTADGIAFDICHDGIVTPAFISCVGHHNVQNALAAFAVGKYAGMTDEEAAYGLSLYKTDGIRQNLTNFGGYKLYLDCYNAAVESMKSAIDTLSSIAIGKKAHRIAVLGDIKETGENGRKYHEAVGDYAAKSNIDTLICMGDDAKYIAKRAGRNKDIKVFTTDTHTEAVELLSSCAKPGDLILFKGSRAMQMELVADLFAGTWFCEGEYATHGQSTKHKGKVLSYMSFPTHAIVTACPKDTSEIVITDTVRKLPITGIKEEAFAESEARSVLLPNTLINIRRRAFYKAVKLRTVIIPNNVKIIDEEAFAGCSGLTEVMIGKACTHIGAAAFKDCPKLRRVHVPASVQYISESAFTGCNEKLDIVCKAGSYAHKFAKKNDIRAVTEDDVPSVNIDEIAKEMREHKDKPSCGPAKRAVRKLRRMLGKR